jgi:cleavage and polyadenylation specificity factor subunit 4
MRCTRARLNARLPHDLSMNDWREDALMLPHRLPSTRPPPFVGLCKKGADTCESLHIYDLSKMAQCQFMLDYGSCSNADCLFNHVLVEVEVVDCIWYSRGFCRHGPNCKNRHRPREMCRDYLAGFCELGPKCEWGHPKWSLPAEMDRALPQYDVSGALIPGSDQPRARTIRSLVGMALPNVPGSNAISSAYAGQRQGPQSMSDIQCNLCKQLGHMAGACPSKSYGGDSSGGSMEHSAGGSRAPRDLSVVQCFRCGERGHYASFCTNPRAEPPPGGWVLPAGAKPKERFNPKRQRTE